MPKVKELIYLGMCEDDDESIILKEIEVEYIKIKEITVDDKILEFYKENDIND